MGSGKLDLADRYQNQPPWVKLWRRRHLLVVPARFAHMAYYACVRGSWFNGNDSLLFRLRACWGIAHGQAHMRMKWYFTLDEIQAEFPESE